jgi:bifunctional UDP-N-acetylglucosamine pyrophosphorylase/glucosamine-1-phosphate N-acetyltransferase
MDIRAIVLAAGKGIRMNSALPKCAHQIIDKAMIEYVVDSLQAINIDEIITVVGYKREILENILLNKTKFAYQEEQLGTAHAVLMTEQHLIDYDGLTLIAIGDMPLITPATYAKLIAHHTESGADLTVLTTLHPNPFGYGRIVRIQDGEIERIVEEKDCTPEQRKIQEINSSVYLVDNQKLFSAIHEIGNNNVQKEFYLTDIIAIFKRKGYKVSGYQAEDYQELSGANDKVQLAQIEAYLQQKVIDRHLLAGVSIHHPQTVVIGVNVQIESGSVILPGSILVGNSHIGENSVIGPYTEINNSQIGAGTVIKYSRIKDSEIGDNKIIGPYAEVLDNETRR